MAVGPRADRQPPAPPTNRKAPRAGRSPLTARVGSVSYTHLILEPVRLLVARGFRIIATGGTHAFLTGEGLKAEFVKKVLEGRPHIVDAMKNREIQLVFNTTEGRQSLEDSFSLRRAALMMKIPYYTTAAGALAAAQAIGALMDGTLEVRSLQSHS